MVVAERCAPCQKNLSSRPKRSEVEGPVVPITAISECTMTLRIPYRFLLLISEHCPKREKLSPLFCYLPHKFSFGPLFALRIDKPVERTPPQMVGAARKFKPGEPHARVSSEKQETRRLQLNECSRSKEQPYRSKRVYPQTREASDPSQYLWNIMFL
jgi:hypothetical protein